MRLKALQLLAFSSLLVVNTFAGDGPGKGKFIDRSNMDTTIKPGDNFYLYANGNWVKNNPVPSSKTRWGSFDELTEKSSQRLKTLLEKVSCDKNKRTSVEQMVGDFYFSGMDSATIESLGYQPIKADLERLSKVNDKKDVIAEIGLLRTMGLGSPVYSMTVAQDRKNVTRYIITLGQGGLTLPDRDYYLKTDATSTKVRAEYADHLRKMFSLVGEDEKTAASSADAVMRIETALAKAQMSRVDLRDPYKTYNKYSYKDLNALTPGISWKSMTHYMKVLAGDSVLVNNPSFFKTADSLLAALPLNDWKSYLRWNVLNTAASYLSNVFVNQSFNFTKVLTGQKEQTPRWQRVTTRVDQSLGELIGQLYVQEYFKPEAKQRMLDLVNNLQQTFAERIKRSGWMSDETKTKALEKLNAFAKNIGYPDKWKTYEGVDVSRKGYFSNIRSSAMWAYSDMVSRMGQPVRKGEWTMTPPTVNAYYRATNNDISFPAGILQFPFFDFDADDAVNYGGIGAVIGHEMTHGFDDQGSKYAADGNLKDWWTKEDATKFRAGGDRVVNQYNAFTVLDTIHVNGRLTLGENLADLGGLNIAYEAFTKTQQFKEGKLIDGLTPSQRFFLNWAQIWRNNALPETQIQRIRTDSHSPGMYRANGPVVNIDAWYDAFNVKPGDKMYVPKEQRIYIW